MEGNSTWQRFYEFVFPSLEDKQRILVVGTSNLSLDILHFVSASMKLTKIQCWVRIHSLPLEY